MRISGACQWNSTHTHTVGRRNFAWQLCLWWGVGSGGGLRQRGVSALPTLTPFGWREGAGRQGEQKEARTSRSITLKLGATSMSHPLVDTCACSSWARACGTVGHTNDHSIERYCKRALRTVKKGCGWDVWWHAAFKLGLVAWKRGSGHLVLSSRG